MPRKKVVLGSSYFPDLIGKDILYIDKTLLIKEFIEDEAKVVLITRPRRWGKTLNMSMLQHFFAPTVIGKETHGMFDGLQIAREANGKYMQYQGQYPVIFITLKDTVGNTLDEIKSKIFQVIAISFGEHSSVIKKNLAKLNDITRSNFEAIIKGTANLTQYESALLILSQCLSVIYERKCYILIDEYDAPLNHAFGKEYFKKRENFEALVEFIRNFFSTGLKDNPYLEKGIITGVFRIAKANIFSGLNNTIEYTLFNQGYVRYFGFTEEEIIELSNPLDASSPYLKCDLAKIKEWYNGYNIGGITIYNPWSIIRYIKSQEVQAYWIETGGSQLIEDILRDSSEVIKHKFEQLIQGNPVEVTLDKFTTFERLTTNQSAFWGMLLNAGYLTINRFIGVSPGQTVACEVRIPNKEVAVFYLEILKSWLNNVTEETAQKESFITALIAGNIEKFAQDLKRFLILSFSSFDVAGDNPERVYHAFMLGLMAHIYGIYNIKSNRESGEGRYDVLLKPKDKTGLAIIFEFKSIDAKSSQKQLSKSAIEALEQIRAKKYESELDQEGIPQRLLIGVAFAGKRIEIRYEKKVSVAFNPSIHVAIYKQAVHSLTATTSPLLLPTSQPTTTCDQIKKIFGEIVDIARTVTGVFEGKDITFDIYHTGGSGSCGFYSLPIPYDRRGVMELLLAHSDDAKIRLLVVPEMLEALQAEYLPHAMLTRYPQFAAFKKYQTNADIAQQQLLSGVLDTIDPTRAEKLTFNTAMEYLVTSDTVQARETLNVMQKFKAQYEAELLKFQRFCQQEEIFRAFIISYIGGTGELSFATGGISFERQNSILDAILEVAKPPIRLCIWEDDKENQGKVKIVYQGGKAEASLSHIYHVRGKDTHFALMAATQVAKCSPRLGKGDIRYFFNPTKKRTQRPEEPDSEESLATKPKH